MSNFIKSRHALVVFMAGAIALSACSTSESNMNSNDSPATEPSTSKIVFDVAMPEPKGIEVTPVVLDPNMAALPSEAAVQVQTALKEFLHAAQSFPELQKGSRPVQATDVEILKPVLKPLMTEQAWQDTVKLMQDPKSIPSWYTGGNPFDAIDIDGKPLEESTRDDLTPDEGGHTVIHAENQPITITSMDSGDGLQWAKASDVHYRVLFKNVLGGIGFIQKKSDFWFVQGEDGSWDLGSWQNKGAHFWAEEQEPLDNLADF